MKDETSKLEALLQDVERSVASIRETSAFGAEAQWGKGRHRTIEPGPGPKGGLPADPTGDVVVEPKRLRIRREMRAAETHLLTAAARLRGTAAALERAVAAWAGPEGLDREA